MNPMHIVHAHAVLSHTHAKIVLKNIAYCNMRAHTEFKRTQARVYGRNKT